MGQYDSQPDHTEARRDARPDQSAPRADARGFTLTDVLVSIAVVTLLITILLPALGKVHEASQRVVCASNLRQVGLGVHMYANDYDMWLPPSSFATGAGANLGTDPLYLKIDGRTRGGLGSVWDGLGYLYSQDYLSDPRVYYCPSHTGSNEFETYVSQFSGATGDIIANYQYRGEGPEGQQRLDLIVDTAALVSDGFREASDINHMSGMNVLRAGMSVNWFQDELGSFYDMALLMGEDGNDDGPNWDDGWSILDTPSEPTGGFWFFH